MEKKSVLVLFVLFLMGTIIGVLSFREYERYKATNVSQEKVADIIETETESATQAKKDSVELNPKFIKTITVSYDNIRMLKEKYLGDKADEEALANFVKLAQKNEVQPVINSKTGRTIGFRVLKLSETFDSGDIKPNDIVLSVNGIEMNSLNLALEALAEVKAGVQRPGSEGAVSINIYREQ